MENMEDNTKCHSCWGFLNLFANVKDCTAIRNHSCSNSSSSTSENPSSSGVIGLDGPSEAPVDNVVVVCVVVCVVV